MSQDNQGFLIYDTEWIPLQEHQINNTQDYYQSNDVFNPTSAKSIDTKDPEILNKMFEPYIFQEQDIFYRLNVSKREASRKELDDLEDLFESKLKEKQARRGGICPIREQLHKELFDEIIRQAAINLPERGLLLMRVRDNLKMTFAAYQTLYEGSLIFGNRKSHVAQSGIGDLENRLSQLKKKKMDLENKKTILENQFQAVEQHFVEINVIEEKCRNDELNYMKNQTKRLQEYLNNFSEN